MRYIVAEKLGEHYAHYEQGKQGRKNAPKHTEIGALIFLFEISFYKLAKKEAMLLYFVHDAVFVSFL